MSFKTPVRLGWIAAGVGGLVCLFVAACGDGGKDACANDLTGRRTLRGHYTISNEHWLFQPCGSDSAVWVDPFSWSQTKGMDLYAQAFASLPPGPDAGVYAGFQPQTVYMEVVADVSRLGVYGHLGKFGQELTVVEVLTASATSPGDCRRVESTVFIGPHPECLL